MWKRKQEAEAVKAVNFCGSESGSTLMKVTGRGSKLGSDYFYPKPEAEANNSNGKEEEANSEA